MAYINTTEELNLYVQSEGDLDFYRIKPYLDRAEREIKHILGSALFDEFLEDNVQDLNLEARKYICGYIANKGISLSLNTLNVKVGNLGVNRQKSSSAEKAEWYELKDLNRDLLSMANIELNDLLVLFDANPGAFPLWENSPYQKKYPNLLIHNLSEFEDFFNLNGSYTTFQALKPFIRDAQVKYIQSCINECYNSSDLTDQILNDIKGALVNYTISEVANTGVFKLEQNGALIKIELMPWEKLEAISDVRLDRLKIARKEQADLYMDNVLRAVQQLPCYVKPTNNGGSIQLLDSGVYLP